MARIAKVYEFMINGQGESRERSDIDKHPHFVRVGEDTVVYTNRHNQQIVYKVLCRGTKAEVQTYRKMVEALVYKNIYDTCK